MKGPDDRCVVRALTLAVAFVVTAAAGNVHATSCGSGTYPFPFTDVGGVNDAFCLGIMEAYVLGVTRGTTATTFNPNDNVPRQQMTTFLQRSIDQGLRRNSRRIALGQWWNSRDSVAMKKTPLLGGGPAGFCKSDGERVWVGYGDRILSVLASTGEVQANFDVSATSTAIGGVLVANGRVLAIDPGAQRMFTVLPRAAAPFGFIGGSPALGYAPNNLTYDGARVWTANFTSGSISIIDVQDGLPTTPGTVISGFTSPIDVIYDGSNVWVAEAGSANRIRKLDANGLVLQSVPVGVGPAYMAFDGANLWVPNFGAASITVVQASTGAVVATLAPSPTNGLSAPLQAAFDGERILVTNTGNSSVTLFRAADLGLIGNVSLGVAAEPIGACSDGINFWVTLRGTGELLRF